MHNPANNKFNYRVLPYPTATQTNQALSTLFYKVFINILNLTAHLYIIYLIREQIAKLSLMEVRNIERQTNNPYVYGLDHHQTICAWLSHRFHKDIRIVNRIPHQ